MALVSINGRKRFFDTKRFELREVGSGRFEVDYDKGTFQIIGGKASGGSAREWLVRNEIFFGDRYLPANSMVEAIELGVQY